MTGKVVVLTWLVGLLLLMSGCGESGGAQGTPEHRASPSPQVTSYSNDEWSFSLEYPADWTQGDTPNGVHADDVQFATAFANVAQLGAPTEAERQRLKAVYVMAKRLPGEASDSEFRSVLDGMASEFETMSKEMPTRNIRVEVTQSGMGGLAGVPSLVADMTMEVEFFKGLLAHQRQYIFGKGDVLYSVSLFAVEDRWQEDEAELETIAQSLVIRP